MPWNRTTRKDYKRDGRRYESDVTDQEWATLEPMIPKQGRGMGDRRIDAAQTGTPGASSRDGLARGLQRHPVCAGHGLSVAGAAG
jgi:hypothetical protein